MTETNNVTTVTSKNKTNEAGQCVTCGSSNTQFTKGCTCAVGGSFLDSSATNKLSFELYLPEHNCTGPGTKLDKRLNADGTSKEWRIPINRADNAAYHHDVCYFKHEDTKTRNEVNDKVILYEFDSIVDFNGENR